MKIAPAKTRRAFAVIIALVAVTVLTILAGAFAYAMKVETKLASNTDDDEEFYWIGRGGVERACWWLAIEGNQPFSSLHQYWNGGEGDGPETNGILATESLNDFPVGHGTVSLSMKELDGYINVNNTDPQMIQQILNTQGVDAGAISEVTDSILDWLDPDDNTRPAGAESDYYLGRTPSYYAKNGPMDSTGELLLIKGVTPKMYFNIGDPSAGGEELGFGHQAGKEPRRYAFALTNVFTAYSAGRVNLNTAPHDVLECIPGLGDGTFQSTAVEDLERARESDPPPRNLQQLISAADINPAVAGQIVGYCSQIGNTYEVTATASIGTVTHKYTAIVFRTGPTVHVVSFYRSQ
jgi:general secretion pathway protein K